MVWFKDGPLPMITMGPETCGVLNRVHLDCTITFAKDFNVWPERFRKSETFIVVYMRGKIPGDVGEDKIRP